MSLSGFKQKDTPKITSEYNNLFISIIETWKLSDQWRWPIRDYDHHDNLRRRTATNQPWMELTTRRSRLSIPHWRLLPIYIAYLALQASGKNTVASSSSQIDFFLCCREIKRTTVVQQVDDNIKKNMLPLEKCSYS